MIMNGRGSIMLSHHSQEENPHSHQSFFCKWLRFLIKIKQWSEDCETSSFWCAYLIFFERREDLNLVLYVTLSPFLSWLSQFSSDWGLTSGGPHQSILLFHPLEAVTISPLKLVIRIVWFFQCLGSPVFYSPLSGLALFILCLFYYSSLNYIISQLWKRPLKRQIPGSKRHQH